MAENIGFVSVALSVTFLLLLNSSVSNGQEIIALSPENMTVCRTEMIEVEFDCLVRRNGVNITAVDWQILVDGEFQSVQGMPRHMTDVEISIDRDTIFGILRVTGVIMDDDGNQYRCSPTNTAVSDIATLTVLDPPPINNIRVDEVCSNDFTISWTSTGDGTGLHYNVILTPPNESLPTMDTYNNFTGLTPNTNYNVTVATQETMACLGLPMEIVITTVTRQAAVPRRVSNLRSFEETFSAITVVWDPADSPNCGSVLYYTVTIVNLNDVADMNITMTSQTRAVLSNLINGTSYNISVTAVNRADSGPTTFIIANTTITRNSEDNPAPSDDDNTGAIIGVIIGVVLFLVVVSAIIVIIVIWWRNYHNQNDNGEKLTSSKSPESPSPVHSDKSNQKSNKRKANSVEQKPLHDAPQYADLQHGTPGAPPSVDRSKVAYCEVKEHEPLKYAEVEHKPGSDEKNIHGAPRVEYKEVWHQ